MRLYIIQPLKMWQQWQRQGVLHTNADYIDLDFLPAYRWMAEQMTQRLGLPPTGCELPIWAWYQWLNVKRAKPDLRTGGFLPAGQIGVRICLMIDEQQVLLSDFDLWHYVLNQWYLGTTLADMEAFEVQYGQINNAHQTGLPTAAQQKIHASWQRIFDVDWHSPGIADPKPAKSLQATIWEVRLEQVVSCETFIAR